MTYELELEDAITQSEKGWLDYLPSAPSHERDMFLNKLTPTKKAEYLKNLTESKSHPSANDVEQSESTQEIQSEEALAQTPRFRIFQSRE